MLTFELSSLSVENSLTLIKTREVRVEAAEEMLEFFKKKSRLKKIENVGWVEKKGVWGTARGERANNLKDFRNKMVSLSP